jgi:hypothetical protein
MQIEIERLPHALKMERWKDFAQRVAKTRYKYRQMPDSAHILEQIEYFFYVVDDEHENGIDFVSWDESVNGENCVRDIISDWYDEIWDSPWGYGSSRQQKTLEGLYKVRERDCSRESETAFDNFVGKLANQYETALHYCIKAGMDMGFV